MAREFLDHRPRVRKLLNMRSSRPKTTSTLRHFFGLKRASSQGLNITQDSTRAASSGRRPRWRVSPRLRISTSLTIQEIPNKRTVSKADCPKPKVLEKKQTTPLSKSYLQAPRELVCMKNVGQLGLPICSVHAIPAHEDRTDHRIHGRTDSLVALGGF
jgi:hypothetical protein